MDWYRRLAGSFFLTAAVAACGPSAPPPETPPGGAVVDGDGGNVVADSATGSGYDTKPVEAPGELVLHLRWKNPGATIATAASFANLPPGFVNSNLRTGVQEILDEIIRGDVNAEKMSQVVDLEAPVDMVGVADISRAVAVPEPMMAWSIGLTSVDGALAASKGKPAPLGPGVWKVGTDNRWGSKCAVSASAGKSPARLVCVDKKRDLETLAAYVARNVAAMPETSEDLSATLELRPVLDKYGRKWSNQARGLPILAKELENGVPAFDQALMDIADALAVEAGGLISDADSIHVGMTLDPSKGLVSKLEVRFAGSKSWTVQTILDGADKKGPAPDLFWQLPASADTVSYGRAGNPSRYEPVLATLSSLLEGALEGEKIGTPGDRKALAALLRLPTDKYAASVGANGHFDAAQGAKPALKDVMDATMGWHIVGIDDDPKGMRSWLNDAVKAYNRPTLQRLIKKELGPDAKNLPKVRTTRAPRELGAGALNVEITVPDVEDPMGELAAPNAGGPSGKPPKPKKVDLTFNILLMGDGARTWIGFSSNPKELAKLMAGLKGNKPGPKSLSTRSDLGRFKSERHNLVTVTSLDGFMGALRPMMDIAMLGAAAAGASQPAQEMIDALEKLPNRGKTPIVATSDVEGGAKPSLVVEMTVPKESLEDLGFLVQKGLTIASKLSGGTPPAPPVAP